MSCGKRVLLDLSAVDVRPGWPDSCEERPATGHPAVCTPRPQPAPVPAVYSTSTAITSAHKTHPDRHTTSQSTIALLTCCLPLELCCVAPSACTMPRATNNSAASNASSSSSPLGPFPKTSTAPSTSSTNPLIPQLPLSAAALSSSSFAAPFTSASTSSSSAASSSSSPLAPTLPPLPPQDDAAEKAAFAELQAEEKAEGTGRMWDRAETERLHKEFQTYWDTTKKAPTSQLVRPTSHTHDVTASQTALQHGPRLTDSLCCHSARVYIVAA